MNLIWHSSMVVTVTSDGPPETTARALTLHHQSGVGGIQGEMAQAVKLTHQRLRQITEVAGSPQRAAQTVIRNRQTS
jgi:hypothetical protein